MADIKKQVVVIHGGDTFDTYEEYLVFLKNWKLDFEELRSGKKNWKENLRSDLGNHYEVIIPEMPNWINAKYLEWKIWFEKITPYLNEELILVGHSLGGTFLSKYLSENDFNKKIEALFLIAPAFDSADSDYTMGDFILNDLKKIASQSNKIFLYHSIDDSVVPYADSQKFISAIGSVELRTFSDRGHFRQEHLPELVEEIIKLN